MFKGIRNILLLIALLGTLTAGIDYTRMTAGEMPIFNLKGYDSKTRIQTFRGLFYIGERKIRVSENEPLVDSSEIKFAVLVFDLDVPRQFKEDKTDFTIYTKETENCNELSKLYYADRNIKIYTYCLDEINVQNIDSNSSDTLLSYLMKDASIIEDIDYNLAYTGLYSDNSTLKFTSRDNEFTNQGLTMYRCNKANINDIYLAPKNTAIQPDFCTYKDDDFKFIYEIVEEETEFLSEEKEVFWEDEMYRYEFSTMKSDRIFIMTPAIRGKQETKIPLKIVLQNQILTIDELEQKGLEFEKIDKAKEQEELIKNQEIYG